ncbi:flap endonuclease 1-A [Leucosporidium creatinivorum]|uniref:Flap endonuclease 1 n=1 Tax=Leucosporidium creatinivorum TaxID=106004 RepID=A0A1Y2EXF1_9BASI|nr:flap endonuclease 1-A [Leucosporidium creatinivorum]
MGIKGLTALIKEHAPHAIKETDIKSLFGRIVSIDASMSMYQFLIAVRQQDGQQLMNEQGETTSHLMGFFYRTLRMIDNDLKPCYVFDGKPPDLKSMVLKKRFSAREAAKEGEEEAKETGTVEDADKLNRRQVKVTRQHNEECQKLLTLMGIPWIIAPSEAEAQCAELCRGGKVYGAGTEDMDTLTFNSPILLRHLTFSEARKLPIEVIKLEDALEGLELTMDQFIDMCMLCGCDYLEPIKGVGAKTALKLIKDYDTFEDIMDHLRKGKNPPPEDWPYEAARELFKHPDVTPASEVELVWKEPDVDGLIEFLVKDKGFAEDRVRKGADRLKARLKTKQQGRLDSFFTVKPKDPKDIKKRKTDDKKDSKSKKAKPAPKKK